MKEETYLCSQLKDLTYAEVKDFPQNKLINDFNK